jgi:hypothetical protein
VGTDLGAIVTAGTPEEAEKMTRSLAQRIALLPVKAAGAVISGLFKFSKWVLSNMARNAYDGLIQPPIDWVNAGLRMIPPGLGMLGTLALSAGLMAAAVAVPALLPAGLVIKLGVAAATLPTASAVVYKGLPWGYKQFGKRAVQQFNEGDETALAGRDGKRAAELLSASKRQGLQVLQRLTEQAARRLLARPDPLAAPVLFDDAELAELSRSLTATNATADLLGRARVRRMAEKAKQRMGAFSEGDDDPFDVFAEPPPYAEPSAASEYFRGLVPSLGEAAERYGPLFARHSFTLAHACDQVILDRVKQVIQDQLRGVGRSHPVSDIQELLDVAGVTPRNPQYAEMVYRTNMMDSYHQGFSQEMASPEMRDTFPVWQYLGIRDGRQGEDHEPHFDRYYPAHATFGEVRGPRVFNCRCSAAPVSKYEWRRAQEAGAKIAEDW